MTETTALALIAGVLIGYAIAGRHRRYKAGFRKGYGLGFALGINHQKDEQQRVTQTEPLPGYVTGGLSLREHDNGRLELVPVYHTGPVS
jgi:hypothetical protein